MGHVLDGEGENNEAENARNTPLFCIQHNKQVQRWHDTIVDASIGHQWNRFLPTCVNVVVPIFLMHPMLVGKDLKILFGDVRLQLPNNFM